MWSFSHRGLLTLESVMPDCPERPQCLRSARFGLLPPIAGSELSPFSGSAHFNKTTSHVVAMVPAGVTLKGVELRPSRGPGACYGEQVGMRRLVRGRPADFCGPL